MHSILCGSMMLLSDQPCIWFYVSFNNIADPEQHKDLASLRCSLSSGPCLFKIYLFPAHLSLYDCCAQRGLLCSKIRGEEGEKLKHNNLR